MTTQIFLGISLLGAEWILYLLILLSILSIALIFERFWFYHIASKGLNLFESELRTLIDKKNWSAALGHCEARLLQKPGQIDISTQLSHTLLSQLNQGQKGVQLSEMALDQLLRGKLEWERNLVILGTIGSNAPFIGLFGTVLGIIKAFHDLSTHSASAAGAQSVSAGLSEALVATAIGILVAIPAVVAFNLFTRKIKSRQLRAEALKNYILGSRGHL